MHDESTGVAADENKPSNITVDNPTEGAAVASPQLPAHSTCALPQKLAGIGAFCFCDDGIVAPTNRPFNCTIAIFENDGTPRVMARVALKHMAFLWQWRLQTDDG
jgi:hypothetical protein